MPASGFTLRPYRPSDFEALVAMDRACFPKSIAYGRREMQSYLHSKGSHCIVAEISGPATPGLPTQGPPPEGMIAGFILTEHAGDLGHVITLDVLEAFRRQSAGSLLLQSAEQQAASLGCTAIYLETATTNNAAIALWKKHGYLQVDTVKNYYGQGQNAFEMLKRLELKSPVRES